MGPEEAAKEQKMRGEAEDAHGLGRCPKCGYEAGLKMVVPARRRRGAARGDCLKEQIQARSVSTASVQSSTAQHPEGPKGQQFQSFPIPNLGNSELRASSAFSARLMEPSASDEDYKILRCLAANKLLAGDDPSWDTTEDKVQNSVLHMLEREISLNIDATKLKERIEAFELMVRRHLEHTEQIVAHKELLLDIFSYITPDFVHGTNEEEDLHAPIRHRGQKRTSNGSDIQHRSKRSSCSESVDHHLAKLLDKREAVQEVLTGTINMENCTNKLQRCGFSGPLLWRAVNMLMGDLELRQVFICLGDSEAKGYMLYTLQNSDV